MTTVDTLSSLVDKSLIVREEHDGRTRYKMLEQIRTFAWDRARTSEREAVLDRHVDHYVRLAARGESELVGEGQRVWLDTFASEHDNFLAALRTSAERDHRAVALLRALAVFWDRRSLLAVGRRQIKAVLAACPDVADLDRAHLLRAAGGMAIRQGDHDDAERCAAEALDIYRRHDDLAGIAGVSVNLGVMAQSQGQLERARTLLEQGIDAFRRSGGGRGVAIGAMALSSILAKSGEHAAARRILEEALEIFGREGDDGPRGGALSRLAAVEVSAGNLEAARSAYEEAMKIARTAGDDVRVAGVEQDLAELAVQEGRLHDARERFEGALAVYRRFHISRMAALMLVRLADLAVSEAELERARTHLREALQISREVSEVGTAARVAARLLVLDEPDPDGRLAEALSVDDQADPQVVAWSLLATACVAVGREAGARARSALEQVTFPNPNLDGAWRRLAEPKLAPAGHEVGTAGRSSDE